MSDAKQARRSLVWPFLIGLLVVVALAAGIGFAVLHTVKKALPAEPGNVKATVTGTALAPTVTVSWTPPSNAKSDTVTYRVDYATARVAQTPNAAAPFQSPCLQVSKTTSSTSMELAAPFDYGVLYAQVIAQVKGKADAPSSTVLVLGPFSKKTGQTFPANHTAKGAIPANEWCRAQRLTS